MPIKAESVQAIYEFPCNTHAHTNPLIFQNSSQIHPNESRESVEILQRMISKNSCNFESQKQTLSRVDTELGSADTKISPGADNSSKLQLYKINNK